MIIFTRQIAENSHGKEKINNGSLRFPTVPLRIPLTDSVGVLFVYLCLVAITTVILARRRRAHAYGQSLFYKGPSRKLVTLKYNS